MNFDATRLAVLSGLSTGTETKTLTESADTGSKEILNEECGCSDPAHDHGSSTDPEAQYEMADEDDVLFEVDEDSAEVAEKALYEDEHEEMNEDGNTDVSTALRTQSIKWLEGHSQWLEDHPEDKGDTEMKAKVLKNLGFKEGELFNQKFQADKLSMKLYDEKWDELGSQAKMLLRTSRLVDSSNFDIADAIEESTVLDMNSLRETVIELRNEILAEQAAEKQSLLEAPARAAIRKEIKSLLSEMPSDAATNWMYGKKGRPSKTDTAAADKSRATALFGLGFETN
jgi:hypothetical protein